MARYRYRTSVLTGPWRDSSEEAMRDAAKAKQAVLDKGSAAIRWIVPGRIEEMSSPAVPSRARN